MRATMIFAGLAFVATGWAVVRSAYTEAPAEPTVPAIEVVRHSSRGGVNSMDGRAPQAAPDRPVAARIGRASLAQLGRPSAPATWHVAGTRPGTLPGDGAEGKEAAQPSHAQTFDKLQETWTKELPDPEWTRNTTALAESFLAEAGLPPESVRKIECRATLCKLELEPDLPMDKLLIATQELEHSGVPVSAQLDFSPTGGLNVHGAFIPKEGFENQIASVSAMAPDQAELQTDLPTAEPAPALGHQP